MMLFDVLIKAKKGKHLTHSQKSELEDFIENEMTDKQHEKVFGHHYQDYQDSEDEDMSLYQHLTDYSGFAPFQISHMLTSHGIQWDSSKHPRDSHGKFVDTPDQPKNKGGKKLPTITPVWQDKKTGSVEFAVKDERKWAVKFPKEYKKWETTANKDSSSYVSFGDYLVQGGKAQWGKMETYRVVSQTQLSKFIQKLSLSKKRDVFPAEGWGWNGTGSFYQRLKKKGLDDHTILRRLYGKGFAPPPDAAVREMVYPQGHGDGSAPSTATPPKPVAKPKFFGKKVAGRGLLIDKKFISFKGGSAGFKNNDLEGELEVKFPKESSAHYNLSGNSDVNFLEYLRLRGKVTWEGAPPPAPPGFFDKPTLKSVLRMRVFSADRGLYSKERRDIIYDHLNNKSSLTAAQRSAVEFYCGSGYETMNPIAAAGYSLEKYKADRAARGKSVYEDDEYYSREMKQAEKYAVTLRDAFKRVKPLDRPVVAYRGLDLGSKPEQRLVGGPDEPVRNRQELSRRGLVILHNGFVSTSLNPEEATNFGHYVMRIVVPKGARAIVPNRKETEIILQPKTHLLVLRPTTKQRREQVMLGDKSFQVVDARIVTDKQIKAMKKRVRKAEGAIPSRFVSSIDDPTIEVYEPDEPIESPADVQKDLTPSDVHVPNAGGKTKRPKRKAKLFNAVVQGYNVGNPEDEPKGERP